jgi:hypothetical protein
MMQEIFKQVKDYEGYYEISNIGNVRSTSYKGTRLLKPAKTKRGYLNVIFCVNQIKVHKLIHRLVAEAFIPNPRNLEQVNHINGNKEDNTVENLEWCTSEYNNQHALNSGLLNRYEDRPEAKLTKELVLKIPDLIKKGATTDDLKDLFKVSRRCIDNIFEGKNWTGLGIDFTKLKPCRKIKNKPSRFQLGNTVLNSDCKKQSQCNA